MSKLSWSTALWFLVVAMFLLPCDVQKLKNKIQDNRQKRKERIENFFKKYENSTFTGNALVKLITRLKGFVNKTHEEFIKPFADFVVKEFI